MGITITGRMLDFVCGQEEFFPAVTPNLKGTPIIGYGHRVSKTETYTVISESAARYLLELDLKKLSPEIERLVTVGMSSNQYLAILDLVYSIGVTTFAYSKVLLNLNQEEYKRAANQFGYLVYDGKERSAKLIRRRAVEKALFLKED